MMKIRRGDLDDLCVALADLGANRLPYRLAACTHAMKEAVMEAIKARDRLRNDLSQPYMPAGQNADQITSDAAARALMGLANFTEVSKKIAEMFNDETEIELGAPVDLTALDRAALDRLVLMESSHGTLKKHGLIIEPA